MSLERCLKITAKRRILRRQPSESMFLTLLSSQFTFQSKVNNQRANRQCLKVTYKARCAPNG